MRNDSKPLKILIIDDELAIRRSFADYLEDRDFQVMTAENGRIGLELLEQECPQVVLVDLRMPEVDGLEVLRQGQVLAPDTPMIVISGVNRLSDVVQALRYGAWDYLIKPVKDLSMLAHAVDKVLEKARLLAENRMYQEQLEFLVRERTEELELANAHLANINARLQKIVETTQGLSSCIDLNRFGSQLLDEFARHMVATGGSLYFVQELGLKRMHSLDPGHAPDFLPFPLAEHSVLKLVLESRKPLLEDDVTHTDIVESSGWNGYRNGSFLAFPIPDKSGKTVGILTLHSKVEPPFVEQDKEIGAILASYSCETLRAVQAFAALQKSEKQYRTLFEKTSDAIFIVEKSTGRYLDANEAAAKLAGRDREELLQLTSHDISPQGASERLQVGSQMGRAEDLGTVSYYRKDGSRRVTKFSSVSLDDDSAIEIARDITEELEKEEQLRRSQKLESIGTLAGGIAHDFNNILTAILGYSELGLSEISPDDPIRENLEAIHRSGMRARDLVAQILTFSRTDTQAQTAIRMDLLLKEALKLLRPAIPATIDIRQHIDTECNVLGDPTRIHQVIMNLCTNAYQAMGKDGGTLEMSLAEVELAGDRARVAQLPEGKYVKMTISDSGCGIAPENLNRIFDPYYTTKVKEKGTGLGLAVVHGIVKKHGGAVTVRSEVGIGTEFEVYLPAGLSRGNMHAMVAVDLPGGMESILLVDDEKNVVSIMKNMLEMLGYTVMATSRPEEALKIFSTQPERFDLVISDMTMPVMTGVQLAEQLRGIAPDVGIIICSGYTENMSPQNSNEHGIDGYLAKPITMRGLAKIVRSTLDGKIAERLRREE